MFAWLKRLTPSPVSVPQQWNKKPWPSIPMLAIDLELTSLDPKQAKIVSAGWVESKHQQIEIGSCYYQVVNTNQPLNQSPVIHGLVERDIVTGVMLKQVLDELSKFAQSHLWVFHNSALDMSVLLKSFDEHDIALPSIILIDTLELSLYQLQKTSHVVPTNGATLTSCRQRHQLPLAPAHNALDDALATLELLYPLLYSLDPQGKASLSDFIHTSAIKQTTEHTRQL